MKERNYAVVVFDGGIIEYSLPGIIPLNFEGDIVINGNLELSSNLIRRKARLWVNGNLTLNCSSLEVNSVFVAKKISCLNIKVKEDIVCYENIDAQDINVNGSLYCTGKIKCNKLTVQEDILCADIYSYCDIIAGNIDITGDLVYKEGNITAYNIYVYSNVTCTNNISVERIYVNGDVQCLGNITAANDIKVDGNLNCQNITSPISNINIGGSLDCCDIDANHITVGTTLNCEKTNVKSIKVLGNISKN